MASLYRITRRSYSTSVQNGLIKTLSKDLYKERNFKRLVDKFKKASEVDRFRTKSGIYEDVVRRLAYGEKFTYIEEILEDQKSYPNISKEGFSVRLISLYGKSGMFDHALKVFDEMPERNCKRTIVSFNALLGACVHSKKFDKVEAYFRELPAELSVKPDLVSYNIAIKGFCDMGSLDNAVSMVDEMEKSGLSPDVITFNALLNGFYANNLFDDGEKIWDQMRLKNVKPNIRSYNAKLVGLVSANRMDEAVELVGKLGDESQGLKPDVFSFNALIKGFCGNGNLGEARKWYEEMKKMDCVPDKTIFSTLVPSLCVNDDFDAAFDMCKEGISKYRRLIDASVLQRVLDGLVKGSKMKEAKQLVELAKSNGVSLALPSDE